MMFTFWNFEMVYWCLFFEMVFMRWFVVMLHLDACFLRSLNGLYYEFLVIQFGVVSNQKFKYLLCIGLCLDIFDLFCFSWTEFLKLEMPIYILWFTLSVCLFIWILELFRRSFRLLPTKSFICEISPVSWTLIRHFL